MLTLKTLAQSLSTADSVDSLTHLATLLGFDGPASAPLDSTTHNSLGLPTHVTHAHVAPGPGSLRCLLLSLNTDSSLPDLLPRIAARLSTTTPHILWLILATQNSSRELAIAAWTADRRPPRVAALVANRTRIVDSDAETLRALAAAHVPSDLLTHTRWVEILGREALTARFYRALERGVNEIAQSSTAIPRADRRELALLNTSRLLFLSFLEAKGWLDRDTAFLAHHFDRCMLAGGGFHTRLLRPLFFGTLNTPITRRAPSAKRFGAIPFLNGGLFTRTPLERRHRALAFSDEAYGNLIAQVFGQYRFTAREESASWNEAAIDPEMLGRAFETLMAAPERQRTGAFYTPFALVERVGNAGLDAALSHATLGDIESLTVLDPACGSGAFLVHVLERLAALSADRGDVRDVCTIRRDLLTRSIFGVDVNPTAVWLCELRLWLSVVIESGETNPAAVMPLPNLDRNIRVGDALSGRAFDDADLRLAGGPAIRRLRQRYARASGPRKESLGRELDRAERQRALAAIDDELAALAAHRRDLLAARRGRNLFGEPYTPSRDEIVSATAFRSRAASLRALRRRIANGGALPFSFSVHFADVASRGGFGLIVGNPPWVRLHHVPAHQRAEYRLQYDVARRAAWEPGASPSGAGRGFAAQVDVAALFVERAARLLGPNAALALLLPVKLWQSLAGGGVRRLIAEELQLTDVEDHSQAPSSFDAAVYPSLIVAQRRTDDNPSPDQPVRVVDHRAQTPFTWRTESSRLPFDRTPGAPWVLLPPDARRAFDRLRELGEPLASSPLGRPRLGVKCGCNEAFLVELLDECGPIATVRPAAGAPFTIERDLLRPLLRGEHLRRWHAPVGTEHIIWTHGTDDAPLATLPPHAARWFARWRGRLEKRTDARHGARWWSLFRTESARSTKPRVIWGDLGREPRASVLAAGNLSVPLNSCYVIRCPTLADAKAFTVLLNSPLARSWLDAIAEPARGGYHRYLGWTLSLLPIPADWPRAREILMPFADLASSGRPPTDRVLFSAALRAFDLNHDDVAPLVAWQCA